MKKLILSLLITSAGLGFTLEALSNPSPQLGTTQAPDNRNDQQGYVQKAIAKTKRFATDHPYICAGIGAVSAITILAIVDSKFNNGDIWSRLFIIKYPEAIDRLIQSGNLSDSECNVLEKIKQLSPQEFDTLQYYHYATIRSFFYDEKLLEEFLPELNSLHEKGLINMVSGVLEMVSDVDVNEINNVSGFYLHRVKQIDDIIHDYIFPCGFCKNRIMACLEPFLSWFK